MTSASFLRFTRMHMHAFVTFVFTVLIFAAHGDTGRARTTSSVKKVIAHVRPAIVKLHCVNVSSRNGKIVKHQSVGSGVIIDRRGYVVTNYHVAGKAEYISCTMWDKREIDATLAGADALTDIALVKLRHTSGDTFSHIPFGKDSSVEAGDRVVALGSPMAFSQSATVGVVSNSELVMPKIYWPFNKVMIEGENVGSLVKWIGHDAAIYSGNSGGALVNLKGELIGINEIRMGISAAIPASQARHVVAQLMEHGSVRRSWTGLELQPLLHTHRKLQGVLISGSIPGSPADSADVRPGDVLVAIGGTPLHARYAEQMPDVNAQLTRLSIDSPSSATLIRNGDTLQTSIRARLREKVHLPEREFPLWGITASNLSFLQAIEKRHETGGGVLISSVNNSGAAASARPAFSQGDIIRRIGSDTVHSVKDLQRLTRALVTQPDADSSVLVAFDRDAQRLQSVVDLSRPADIDQGDVVDKAWIPVQVQALTARIARSRSIEAREGVIVTRVYPTDSKIKAHLTVGDVITHINDRVVPCSHVHQAEVFHSMIRRFTPGDTVTLRRIRGETPQRVTFTLRAFPRMPGKKDLYTSTQLGFVARELVLMDRLKMRLSPSTVGVLISEVKEGSWAALANCAVDDIVCAVNGQPVTSIEEMKKEIATAEKRNREHVIFRIQRGIHTLFLELKTDWNDENEFE